MSIVDPNVFLTYEERKQLHDLGARGHRCPNDPCPSCDRLPGGWNGWCRCGIPHTNAFDVCSNCDRELFWQEMFW